MSIDDPFAHLHDESYADAYAACRAGHAGLIAMAGRKPLSLNGQWRFTLDLFDEGLRQKWYRDTLDPPEAWTAPRDYDEAAAELVPVPSCWSMLRAEWRYFEGAAWYARHFHCPPALHGERSFLRVGAANYEARVFLNGEFLASHRGGSTPFFVEVTRHLRAQGNHLQIQVDNRRSPTRVPMNHFDWFNHGGVHRDVELVVVPALFIRDARVALVGDGAFDKISIAVRLSGPATVTAHIAIPELGISQSLQLTEGVGDITIPARPVLWSPDNPKLYDVDVACEGDMLRERIGFREIRAAGETMLLNGEKLYLRGVCVHEDDAHLGRVTDDADIRRRFAHARELGANFMRLAHYPHHERVAEIADELGILLWAEIPVYWAIAFDNPDTYADAENQLLELIRRDANRASVIIWGVGNENADTDARYRFMSALACAARAADPTRMIGAACLINREKFEIQDRLADDLDVIGLNEYFGWYEPDFSGLERLLANSRPGKPVVISEVGADAQSGHHGGTAELFTEECQAEIYRRQLQILETAPYVQGFVPWILYDYRTERRQTRFQRGWNRKGLIAEDKTTKKRAFGVLADYYHALRGRNEKAAEGVASGR